MSTTPPWQKAAQDQAQAAVTQQAPVCVNHPSVETLADNAGPAVQLAMLFESLAEQTQLNDNCAYLMSQLYELRSHFTPEQEQTYLKACDDWAAADRASTVVISDNDIPLEKMIPADLLEALDNATTHEDATAVLTVCRQRISEFLPEQVEEMERIAYELGDGDEMVDGEQSLDAYFNDPEATGAYTQDEIREAALAAEFHSSGPGVSDHNSYRDGPIEYKAAGDNVMEARRTQEAMYREGIAAATGQPPVDPCAPPVRADGQWSAPLQGCWLQTAYEHAPRPAVFGLFTEFAPNVDTAEVYLISQVQYGQFYGLFTTQFNRGDIHEGLLRLGLLREWLAHFNLQIPDFLAPWEVLYRAPLAMDTFGLHKSFVEVLEHVAEPVTAWLDANKDWCWLEQPREYEYKKLRDLEDAAKACAAAGIGEARLPSGSHDHTITIVHQGQVDAEVLQLHTHEQTPTQATTSPVTDSLGDEDDQAFDNHLSEPACGSTEGLSRKEIWDRYMACCAEAKQVEADAKKEIAELKKSNKEELAKFKATLDANLEAIRELRASSVESIKADAAKWLAAHSAAK
ncbi:hypothetical protein P6F34_gp43 [Pseudomonas phage MiCath]|uniref:Uncharacterized protein n=1 Tax=Pseudomonas phage MiCath TaxID=3003729 RepID=A0AAE9VJW3_9CAUD|nr:hypothetical protein P6F34_gp43 [Pseudomonas phage MiCath]WAX22395.1 hypothetical protein [Pseudomonas phage MiCath]